MAPQDEPFLTQDPSLPEGIFRDESGAYHWIYHVDMKRNPVLLRMTLKTVLCVTVFVALAFAIMAFVMAMFDSYSIGDALKIGIKLLLIVSGGGCAVFALATHIAWRAMRLVYGRYFVYEYLMTEERIVVMQGPEEQARTDKMATVWFALSLLSNDLHFATAGMADEASKRTDSVYKDVRKVIAVPRYDAIRVNNLLLRNAVFANAQQYDFVWDYITSHCVNAKIKC